MPYDREKVIAGLQKACYKRPISAEVILETADRIEEDIFRSCDKEVTSRFVGEAAMKHLRRIDKVAYIRFASVYREFNDAGELLDEFNQALHEPDSTNQPGLFGN